MTDKNNRIQSSARFAPFVPFLHAPAAPVIIGPDGSGLLKVHAQFKAGDTDTSDDSATVSTIHTDEDTVQDSAISGLARIKSTENPRVISDACLPDTLHGPPGMHFTTA